MCVVVSIVFYPLSFCADLLTIQSGVSEIENNIDGDHDEVEYVEDDHVGQLSGNEFACNPKGVAGEDEEDER